MLLLAKYVEMQSRRDQRNAITLVHLVVPRTAKLTLGIFAEESTRCATDLTLFVAITWEKSPNLVMMATWSMAMDATSTV